MIEGKKRKRATLTTDLGSSIFGRKKKAFIIDVLITKKKNVK